MIECIKIPGGYRVLSKNGVFIGEIFPLEDGFYQFFPDLSHGRGGYWDAEVLRALANQLDSLNKDWQDQINEYFMEE